ncbi:MAG: hypothetical protein MPN21_05200 [Thermoanaerobaculia bacterium]|nr:hypothetical protein [Thermoanaerobaculia bacterium]
MTRAVTREDLTRAVTREDSTHGSSWRADLKAVGVLLVMVALHVATLELTEPSYFLRDDNAAYFLPVYVHTAETLWASGELAFLNYHQYLGQRHLAMGQTGVLYPPVYVAHALARLGLGEDVRILVLLLVLGHLLVASAGFFVLARTRDVPRWIAAGCALLWLTFPFLSTVTRNWIWVAYGAAWVPWCLVFLDSWLSRGMRWALGGYAVAKALFCLAGYAQYVVLSVLFEAIWIVSRTLGESRTMSVAWWRRMAGAAAALIASGGLAAPLLLPMWGAKERSQARAGELSLEESLSNAMDMSVFWRAQTFDMAERAIHQGTGAIFYLGVPILSILGIGLLWLLIRKQARRLLVSMTTLIVALVLSTEAVRVLHAVPLLGSFRWPFKSFLWVSLFAALAVALVLRPVWRRGRSAGATAALVLSLGITGNLVAIHGDDWDRPFGPNRVQRSVGELRQEAKTLLDGPQQGRAVAMWMSHGQEDIERFLTHNYATLARGEQLGGYEPLISRQLFDLAKGLQYSNIWRYELTRDSLDYLSEWSVRWLLMPDKPRNRAIVGTFPELRVRELRGTAGLLVVENTAAAPFAFLEPSGGGPPIPLHVSFGGRGLTIDLQPAAGRGGLLRIQVAPISGYEWIADGEEMGPVLVDDGSHVVLDVPAESRSVDIRYRAILFELGVAVALITALVGVWWLFRRRPKRRGSTTPEPGEEPVERRPLGVGLERR